MAKDYPVTYAQGYETSDDVIRDDLIAEAVAAAKAAMAMCGLNLYRKEQCDAY